jgi:hypothetical protein
MASNTTKEDKNPVRSNVKKTIITSYTRTAIGTFLGSLREAPVEVLGAMQSRRNSRKMYSKGAGNV